MRVIFNGGMKSFESIRVGTLTWRGLPQIYGWWEPDIKLTKLRWGNLSKGFLVLIVNFILLQPNNLVDLLLLVLLLKAIDLVALTWNQTVFSRERIFNQGHFSLSASKVLIITILEQESSQFVLPLVSDCLTRSPIFNRVTIPPCLLGRRLMNGLAVRLELASHHEPSLYLLINQLGLLEFFNQGLELLIVGRSLVSFSRLSYLFHIESWPLDIMWLGILSLVYSDRFLNQEQI